MKADLVIMLIAKLYSSLLAFIVVPFLIMDLGVEAYGLVGVLAIMQSTFSLLDVGLGSALTRLYIENKTRENLNAFIKLFSKFIVYYLLVSLVIFIISILFSDDIAKNFINSTLDVSLVSNCILIMFFIFISRFIQSPFRAVVLGDNRQKSLAFIDIVSVSLGAPLCLFVFLYTEVSIVLYFNIMLFSSLIRLLMMYTLYRKIIREKECHAHHNHNEIDFKSTIIFGLKISLLSIIWIVYGLVDKYVLVATMELRDYSVYSLAITLMGAVAILSVPLDQLFLPRLTQLYVSDESNSFISLTNDLVSNVSLIMLVIVIFFWEYGTKIVYFWLQDENLSYQVYRYSRWLLSGASIMMVANYAYLICYAKGKLDMHIKVNLCYYTILIPTTILVALNYGAENVAILYFLASCIYFLAWPLIVFMKESKLILYKLLFSLLSTTIISTLVIYLGGHVKNFLEIPALVLLVMLISLSASNCLGDYIFKRGKLNNV